MCTVPFPEQLHQRNACCAKHENTLHGTAGSSQFDTGVFFIDGKPVVERVLQGAAFPPIYRARQTSHGADDLLKAQDTIAGCQFGGKAAL